MLTCLASPKYMAAKNKYASKSQHGRLASKPHFGKEVVDWAKDVEV